MSNERKRAPIITTALVEWLEELFPNRCPKPDESDREVWMNVGAARTIARVRQELKRQEEDPAMTFRSVEESRAAR